MSRIGSRPNRAGIRSLTISRILATPSSGSRQDTKWKSLSGSRAQSGIRPSLMRWALAMMRLSAAWRKTSVSRTTRHRARADDVGEHLARADRRQLVDVADQDQRGVIGHRPQERVHQRHVDHRRLVDHEQVARQRFLLIPLEAARPRIDLEQAVDGLRLAAGALAEPLGCTSGRRRQGDLDALGSRAP